jgi:hypothetical protein
MAIKIDNHFPDSDCIVIDTKKHQVSIYRDEDGEVHVTLWRKDSLDPVRELILGKE